MVGGLSVSFWLVVVVESVRVRVYRFVDSCRGGTVFCLKKLFTVVVGGNDKKKYCLRKQNKKNDFGDTTYV